MFRGKPSAIRGKGPGRENENENEERERLGPRVIFSGIESVPIRVIRGPIIPNSGFRVSRSGLLTNSPRRNCRGYTPDSDMGETPMPLSDFSFALLRVLRGFLLHRSDQFAVVAKN